MKPKYLNFILIAIIGILSAPLCRAQAPAAPVATITVSANTATLTWSAVSGATSYKVYRSTISGGPYSNIGSTTATSYADTSLATGLVYDYVVTSVGAGGEGPQSAQVSAPALAIPTLFAFSDLFGATGSYGVANLTWPSVTNATGYNVYRCSSSGGTYTLVASPTAICYQDQMPDSGGDYYVVKAIDKVGSATVSVSAASSSAFAKLGYWVSSSSSNLSAPVGGTTSCMFHVFGTSQNGTIALTLTTSAGGAVSGMTYWFYPSSPVLTSPDARSIIYRASSTLYFYPTVAGTYNLVLTATNEATIGSSDPQIATTNITLVAH